jgi:hypothetical protein
MITNITLLCVIALIFFFWIYNEELCNLIGSDNKEKKLVKNFFRFIEEHDEKKIPPYIKFSYFQNELTKNDLHVKGDLNLSNVSINTLPDGLLVDGDLNLRHTHLKKLPNNLTVKGNLDLYGSRIETLPEKLKVGGDLTLSFTTIPYLPKDISLEGRLKVFSSTLGKKYTTREFYNLIPTIKDVWGDRGKNDEVNFHLFDYLRKWKRVNN